MRTSEISRRALLAGAASTAAAVAGCVSVAVEPTYERSVSRSFGVAVSGLSVAVPSGEVAVEGAADDDVTLEGELVAARRSAVDGATVVRDHSGGHLEVGVDRPDGEGVGVDWTFEVPRSTRVAEVAVGDGSVSADGVRGPLRVDATRCTVDATDVVGALDVAVQRGSVTVSGVDGRVDVSASEAEVAVSDVDGDVSVTGVDGDVSVADVDGDVSVDAGVGFVGVDGVTGDATVSVESGDVSVTDVDGEVWA